MLTPYSKVAGLHFEPPIILASGILGQTSSSMLNSLKGGFGGIVTKSIGLEPREGHPNPTMLELNTGLLNAMGLPNPGIGSYRNELQELILHVDDIPVIGSIFASDEEHFAEIAMNMEGCGADAVELNLSCPHAKGFGAALGNDQVMAGNMVLAVRNSVDIPVLVKLPPADNIAQIGLAVQGAGADAIVAINTLKAMAIDVETKKPFLGNRVGGYSGPGIKPVGLRCVYELFSTIDIPIIGCGGINTGRDVLEYILAGASALQIGSALYYRGKDAPHLISKEMCEIMESEGIGTIEEITGAAHDYI